MYRMNSSRYSAHIDHLIAYLYTTKIKITALFIIEMFYNINKIQNNNLLSMLIEKFGCTCIYIRIFNENMMVLVGLKIGYN